MRKCFSVKAHLSSDLQADLRIGCQSNKMIENGNRVRAVDERCAPGRILFAAVGVRNWYLNFTSSISPPSVPLYHQQHEADMAQIAASTMPVAPILEVPPADNHLDFAATDNGAGADWEDLFYYSSNTADFGLDMLFDEELQPFRERNYDDAAYQVQA